MSKMGFSFGISLASTVFSAIVLCSAVTQAEARARYVELSKINAVISINSGQELAITGRGKVDDSSESEIYLLLRPKKPSTMLAECANNARALAVQNSLGTTGKMLVLASGRKTFTVTPGEPINVVLDRDDAGQCSVEY